MSGDHDVTDDRERSIATLLEEVGAVGRGLINPSNAEDVKAIGQRTVSSPNFVRTSRMPTTKPAWVWLTAVAVLVIVLIVGFQALPQSNHSTHRTTPSGQSNRKTGRYNLPKEFRAGSAAFVSAQDGWVLGTIPCPRSGFCVLAPPPVLFHTRNGGQTWTKVTAPYDTSIDRVQFADSENGWLWATTNVAQAPNGDDMWETHDGGLHWKQLSFPGTPSGSVSDVNAAAGIVSASFVGFPTVIETSPVGIDHWTLAATLPSGAGGDPTEQIVLQGDAGWVIDEDNGVLGGARMVNGVWSRWTPPCTKAGTLALLATSDATHLFALCIDAFGGASPPALLSVSDNGGSTFDPVATAAPSYPPDDVEIASPTPETVIMAGQNGSLLATFNGGATWSIVKREAASTIWLQIGFTTRTYGFAVDGNGVLYMTTDGGHHWYPAGVQPS